VLYRPLANRSATGVLSKTAYEFTTEESDGWSETNPSCSKTVAAGLIAVSVVWTVVAGLAVGFLWRLAGELGVHPFHARTGGATWSALAEHALESEAGAAGKSAVCFLAMLPTVLYLRAEEPAERAAGRETDLSLIVNACIVAILTSGVQLFVWWMGRRLALRR
jgi:hypothetical protein